MVAVQNLKGEIIQLILSRKGGGMYLVSATPTIASRGYHSVRSLTVLVIHSFRIESVTVLFSHDSICTMCFLQQTISHMRKRFPEWVPCQVVCILRGLTCQHWILYWMQENQTSICISFVLGYLRMILWKISTAISIKHQILATFNIKKKINSDGLYAFNEFCISI